MTAVSLPAARTRVWVGWPLLVLLAGSLVVMTLLAAGSGQLAVPPDEVLGSFLHGIGLDLGPMPSHPQGDSALWAVRFPRVGLAVVVGACLAVAGAMLQGVFGNPLAEPAVVGVSSGAAVGACAVIVGGVSVLGNWTIAAAAFFGGLVTTVLVYALARSGGRTEVVTLVLTGIAVNAVAFGIIAFLTFVADPGAREQIVFWQLGSLNGATGPAVGAVLPLAVAGMVIAALVARRLDLLALGEGPARHLGVNVERLRLVVVLAVAMLVGSGVAFAGIVGFVGLVVPHLIRMIAGPAHGPLLAASALGGALVLVSADLLARTAVENAELPLGMLTSLVGGPFFFWLLRRTRSRHGGWA
ncbi:FecCD family ABC transporter permease [Actinophytocola gossypii]|uniref:Iron ABC transporter permease n=1 Tax=Actinophytocola gossypii TaxID=2812003 RepID=A0ABT2JFW3_9PSEU|nr:iron ABC transporter permease [Actinophytocola gossypii]MCT2586762.1 iron ABC transporter permease [Actinophytocola gossypii]